MQPGGFGWSWVVNSAPGDPCKPLSFAGSPSGFTSTKTIDLETLVPYTVVTDDFSELCTCMFTL